jgi:hypothetical protein
MRTTVTGILFGLSLLSFNVWADEEAQVYALKSIPTEEKAFVDSINQYTKVQIVELLGEPAKADDVKLKDSGRVVASIWHYHNINTDVNGTYYQTTELDFIDDKVVMVVFLNNDGSESQASQQPYTPLPPEFFEGDGSVERIDPRI